MVGRCQVGPVAWSSWGWLHSWLEAQLVAYSASDCSSCLASQLVRLVSTLDWAIMRTCSGAAAAAAFVVA